MNSQNFVFTQILCEKNNSFIRRCVTFLLYVTVDLNVVLKTVCHQCSSYRTPTLGCYGIILNIHSDKCHAKKNKNSKIGSIRTTWTPLANSSNSSHQFIGESWWCDHVASETLSTIIVKCYRCDVFDSKNLFFGCRWFMTFFHEMNIFLWKICARV